MKAKKLHLLTLWINDTEDDKPKIKVLTYDVTGETPKFIKYQAEKEKRVAKVEIMKVTTGVMNPERFNFIYRQIFCFEQDKRKAALALADVVTKESARRRAQAENIECNAWSVWGDDLILD